MKKIDYSNDDVAQKQRRLRDKYKAIYEYAQYKGWLFLEDVKETEDDLPRFLCLTPCGKVIDISLTDDTIDIDNGDGDFTINF